MGKWVLSLLLCLYVVSFTGPTAFASPLYPIAAASDSNTITNQNDETKTYRYRSGRRSYKPSPNYNAPVRTTPRYQAPAPVRRTGGFLGGIGSFFAGAFLGSMLFSPFFGGYGHFSLLGLIIDVLMIYLIYRLIRKLFWRARH